MINTYFAVFLVYKLHFFPPIFQSQHYNHQQHPGLGHFHRLGGQHHRYDSQISTKDFQYQCFRDGKHTQENTGTKPCIGRHSETPFLTSETVSTIGCLQKQSHNILI